MKRKIMIVILIVTMSAASILTAFAENLDGDAKQLEKLVSMTGQAIAEGRLAEAKAVVFDLPPDAGAAILCLTGLIAARSAEGEGELHEAEAELIEAARSVLAPGTSAAWAAVSFRIAEERLDSADADVFKKILDIMVAQRDSLEPRTLLKLFELQRKSGFIRQAEPVILRAAEVVKTDSDRRRFVDYANHFISSHPLDEAPAVLLRVAAAPMDDELHEQLAAYMLKQLRPILGRRELTSKKAFLETAVDVARQHERLNRDVQLITKLLEAHDLAGSEPASSVAAFLKLKHEYRHEPESIREIYTATAAQADIRATRKQYNAIDTFVKALKDSFISEVGAFTVYRDTSRIRAEARQFPLAQQEVVLAAANAQDDDEWQQLYWVLRYSTNEEHFQSSMECLDAVENHAASEKAFQVVELNKAYLLMKSNRPHEAKDILKNYKPEETALWYYLVASYGRTGNIEEAFQAFMKGEDATKDFSDREKERHYKWAFYGFHGKFRLYPLPGIMERAIRVTEDEEQRHRLLPHYYHACAAHGAGEDALRLLNDLQAQPADYIALGEKLLEFGLADAARKAFDAVPAKVRAADPQLSLRIEQAWEKALR